MKKNRIKAAWVGLAECRRCAIRNSVLFADLTESDFNLVHEPIDEIAFNTGSVIYSTGDVGHWVFTVRSGLVKLVQYLPNGTQRIVHLLRQGAAAGMEALLGHPYEHAAIVLREALVCRIPITMIKDLNTKTPRLHLQLMTHWHQSVREADEWLTQLSTGTSRARMARLLLSMATGRRCECEVFSAEDLGAMLSITPETASRIMAEFKRSRVLTPTEDNLCRCDIEALNEMLLD